MENNEIQAILAITESIQAILEKNQVTQKYIQDDIIEIKKDIIEIKKTNEGNEKLNTPPEGREIFSISCHLHEISQKVSKILKDPLPVEINNKLPEYLKSKFFRINLISLILAGIFLVYSTWITKKFIINKEYAEKYMIMYYMSKNERYRPLLEKQKNFYSYLYNIDSLYNIPDQRESLVKQSKLIQDSINVEIIRKEKIEQYKKALTELETKK